MTFEELQLILSTVTDDGFIVRTDQNADVFDKLQTRGDIRPFKTMGQYYYTQPPITIVSPENVFTEQGLHLALIAALQQIDEQQGRIDYLEMATNV